MINHLAQETSEYHDNEDVEIKKQKNINKAVTESLATLSPTSFYDSLTEIHYDDPVKPDSPEDLFYELLTFIRKAANKEQATNMLPANKVERALYLMVWKSHRRFDVEPGWNE